MTTDRVYLIHYNKAGSKNGEPWTIHGSKGCFLASKVLIDAPMETVYKPDKKANPKAWLRVKGTLTWNGKEATIF